MRAAASVRREPAGIDFADYLEAKAALDERSLNAGVLRACIDHIRLHQPLLRWLDAGTGTGAMVRRLLRSGIPASLSITALDRDPNLLEAASAKLAAQLERDDYRTRRDHRSIAAQNARQRITIDLPCGDLLHLASDARMQFDLITAHALIDVVPLQSAVARIQNWLAPGGLFYATLTYDGDTRLFPSYADPEFETTLLAHYDASMEQRRVNGEATGGADAGRRLHAILSQTGFDMIACGRSDWNVTPCDGRYRDRDADVLRALLGYMRGEGEREPLIDRGKLARWHAARHAAIDRAELGIIVRHVDVLASRAEASRP
jgi:SAM-dependent methyltransferase